VNYKCTAKVVLSSKVGSIPCHKCARPPISFRRSCVSLSYREVLPENQEKFVDTSLKYLFAFFLSTPKNPSYLGPHRKRVGLCG